MALQVTIPTIEPSQFWEAVTPSDTTVLVDVLSIYVGTTGDVVATDQDGTDATFVAVPAGTVLPISPSKIKAATTASDIVALK